MLFLFSWVVVGCAGSKPREGSEPPKAWINNAGFPVASPQKDLARWWARFDDPHMSKLIADGLAGNFDIASATARVREEMQKAMQKHCAVFRDQKLMDEGVAKLAEQNKRMEDIHVTDKSLIWNSIPGVIARFAASSAST